MNILPASRNDWHTSESATHQPPLQSVLSQDHKLWYRLALKYVRELSTWARPRASPMEVLGCVAQGSVSMAATQRCLHSPSPLTDAFATAIHMHQLNPEHQAVRYCVSTTKTLLRTLATHLAGSKGFLQPGRAKATLGRAVSQKLVGPPVC